jgi:hypothetical protein
MFEERYLGFNFGESHPYLVECRVAVHVRRLGIFATNGWEYHRWIESYLESLREFFDQDEFLRRIAWTQIEAFIRVQENGRSAPN